MTDFFADKAKKEFLKLDKPIQKKYKLKIIMRVENHTIKEDGYPSPKDKNPPPPRW